MRTLGLIVLMTAAALVASAQDIVSARSGMIHRLEGVAHITGKEVQKLNGVRFPVMAVDQVLDVEDGYVEVLLTPGAFLRLDSGGSFRLVANELDDTRLELLTGTALVEVAELLNGNHISVTVRGFQTALLKAGLYSFDAEAGRLKVFDGKAETSGGGSSVRLGKADTIPFDSVQLNAGRKPIKFDTKRAQDSLYAWSQQRSAQLAASNISVSQNWGGPQVFSSMWVWDISTGMYTFLPASGKVSSVWGGRWYNPLSIATLFVPQTFSRGGSSSGGQNSGSGGVSSSPGSSSPGPSTVTSTGGGNGGSVSNTTSSGATVTHSVGGHSQ